MSMDEIIKKIKALSEEDKNMPVHRRYKSNDATIEKIGEMLRENPNGFLILRDELVGLLATWEKAGHEGDRTFFLESWNGFGSFDSDRIGRGHIFVPNLCLSVFGGIQPDKLRALLELIADALANDGTLQRFQMLVYPDPIKWKYCDSIPDKEARDKVFELFESLADLNPENLGAAPADEFNKFPYFHFSPEAQKIYIDWSGKLNEKMDREESVLLVQHLAKYEKLFPALALILHIVDCLSNGTKGAVSDRAALMAVAWCDYLETHARRCYGLLADGGLCAAQHLSKKIRDGNVKDGFTARNIRRHAWSHLKTEETIQAALERLEDAHWLRPSSIPAGENGGRPTTVYYINPKISQKDATNVA